MTNETIKNPYLRGLLARELLGYRKSYWKSCRYSSKFTDKVRERYHAKTLAARRSFSTVDIHLRRHSVDLICGNIEQLKKYPAGFAGH